MIVLSPILSHSLNGLGAAFWPAYTIVKGNEGGYVNNKADKGGMTYMGIARNIWPNWAGWKIIDEFHSNSGIELSAGAFLPLYEQNQILPLVESFYRSLWQKSRAGEITNQNVANIYFDFYVLSSKAVELMQIALNQLGQKVSVDNSIGPQTIAAINAVDPAKLHDLYKRLRLAWHKDMVKAGVVDAQFLPGWQKRTAGFPSLASGSVWFNTLLFTGGLALVLLAYNANQKIKMNDYEK